MDVAVWLRHECRVTLNLTIFSHNHHPSGANLLVKTIRRGVAWQHYPLPASPKSKEFGGGVRRTVGGHFPSTRQSLLSSARTTVRPTDQSPAPTHWCPLLYNPPTNPAGTWSGNKSRLNCFCICHHFIIWLARHPANPLSSKRKQNVSLSGEGKNQVSPHIVAQDKRRNHGLVEGSNNLLYSSTAKRSVIPAM